MKEVWKTIIIVNINGDFLIERSGDYTTVRNDIVDYCDATCYKLGVGSKTVVADSLLVMCGYATGTNYIVHEYIKL